MPSVEAINSQIEILEKRLKRMERKLRIYIEETGGNPDPGTVIEYNRIMEVDAINRDRLKKELNIYSTNS
jgi:hypothetical protein